MAANSIVLGDMLLLHEVILSAFDGLFIAHSVFEGLPTEMAHVDEKVQ